MNRYFKQCIVSIIVMLIFIPFEDLLLEHNLVQTFVVQFILSLFITYFAIKAITEK